MIRLVKTCCACPEQYDAFLGEKQVGYLRLRHGRFTVHCPNSDGKLVYDSHTVGDGMFTYEERPKELDRALEAIRRWLKGDDEVVIKEEEDYNNFSAAALERAIKNIFADIKSQTGATDAELNKAFAVVATRIMSINMLKEPKNKA